MAQNGACTAIVWCDNCSDSNCQATAHIYDGDGCYMFSVRVDCGYCLGGRGVVVYNLDDIVVANPSGGGRPTTMGLAHAAANFDKIVLAIDANPHTHQSTRQTAEQAVKAGNYRQLSVPIGMLSPHTRMLLRKHHSEAGAPTAAALGRAIQNIRINP